MDSILLQKQVRDNAKDLQDFCKELKEWGDDMKKKDESLKRTKTPESKAISPKNKVSKVSEAKVTSNDDKSESEESKRIGGSDYDWDKSDYDSFYAALDKCENRSSESSVEICTDFANFEKEKGNAFVKKQQWDEAIDCYTKAIEYCPYNPIYFANRALCYLKKEKYLDVVSDCTRSLHLDKTYVKAYLRRAAARENLNEISKAGIDLMKILKLEPKNKEAETALLRIKKKSDELKEIKPDAQEEQRPVSKFTLSRQQHKGIVELPKKNIHKEDVTAFSKDVVERRVPCNSNQETSVQASTSSYKTEPHIKQEAAVSISKSDNVPVITRQYHTTDPLLYRSIYKSPKTRSKVPLKRIQVIDVGLGSEIQFFTDTFKDSKQTKDNKSDDVVKHDLGKELFETLSIKSHHPESKEEKEKENIGINNLDMIVKGADGCVSENLEIKKVGKDQLSEPNDNLTSFRELNLSTPKTSVQFYNSWKSISKNISWCILYLLQIKPGDLPKIFKESLDSKVFSEILEAIGNKIASNISLVDYLLALIQVKRFGALVMFMSSKDKQCITNVIDFLKQTNTQYTNTDIDNVIKSYEL